MKKSLVSAVLAGLLAGCVMIGAEAADPIDIVIHQDGSVTPNTYGGGNYIGVSGTQNLGSNVNSIKTDGWMSIGTYDSYFGYDAYGIYLNSGEQLTGNSISEIEITVSTDCYGILSDGGNIQLYDVGDIYAEGYFGRAVSLSSSNATKNILTFENGKGEITLYTTGQYIWAPRFPDNKGLFIENGENYIGTKDDACEQIAAEGLHCISVDAIDEACGIDLCGEGKSVIAFDGALSSVGVCSQLGEAVGIRIAENHEAKIVGLGNVEAYNGLAASLSSIAVGIDIGSSKKVEIEFDAAASYPATIRVDANKPSSYGIVLHGSNVVINNIKKIEAGSDGLISEGSRGIAVYSGTNEINFIGDSKIISKSMGIMLENPDDLGNEIYRGEAIGIDVSDGTTTVTGLKSIEVSVNHDNNPLSLLGGPVGIRITGGTMTIANLKSITAVYADGGQGEAVSCIDTDGNVNLNISGKSTDFLIINGSVNNHCISEEDSIFRLEYACVNGEVLNNIGAKTRFNNVNIIGATKNHGSLFFSGDSSVGNVEGHEIGSGAYISYYGTLTVEDGLLQFTGNQRIENKVVIKNGASFDPKADYLSSDTTVEAGGKLYVSTGTLSTNIKGAGTTYLKANPTSTAKETVTVNTNQSIEGTLNGSDGTIKLAGGTAYTLTVGKLAGITNLDVAVNFNGGNAVNGMMSIGAAELGAVLNVSNVNVTADIPDGTNNGVVIYATGAGVADVTHKVNGQVGGSITASANKLYTFTQDTLNPGKLNWSVQTTSTPITFKEFIEGTYEGKPSTLSLTENMVDGPNGGTADSGLASQTNDKLYINLNGHTLGTEDNKFTVKVAGSKEVYLNGGTGYPLPFGYAHTSWKLGEEGVGPAYLYTSGDLLISGDIEGVGALINDGTVMIDGNINGSLLLINNNFLGLEGREINVGQITNSGELIINSDYISGNYHINGDVYHNAGARTEINLVGTNNGEGMAALSGRVYGSDENFKMTLERAEWLMDNVVDRSTVDFGTVHNVSLEKGGSISTNLNTLYYVDNTGSYASAVAWRNVYGTATFHNLRSDGTGIVALAVDLANNVGDQIVLQGETPEKLGVALVNKDNNGGEAFVPDGEHSVTYAKAPLGSDLEIDTSLVPMYGKQSMIYTPIVEIGEGDGERLWNFVGWSQRPREDSKLNAKDELDIPDLLPEMEEKRLEEIHRYAVHKDLSELGAWVRGETGKMSADGVDFDVKVISGGYDWANKTSKGNFFMGLGVSHGTSDADMSFVGDSKNTSFSVYGSWYGRKNYDYIDFVAKYGKIDHQYNGINFENVPCSGEYDKNMYSFFAKYGRRLPLKNGFYIEPFGSVTYGHIGDADFYDNGQDAHMHVNSILSKILSVGAMFGRSVKGTELYCKLAYSYDFDGEIRGSVPEQNYSEKTDMGGSSYKFAVGASRNLGKQNSLHLDLEKDFGGKMKRPWNLALTFKHTW